MARRRLVGVVAAFKPTKSKSFAGPSKVKIFINVVNDYLSRLATMTAGDNRLIAVSAKPRNASVFSSDSFFEGFILIGVSA
jgi:hypothetical protein